MARFNDSINFETANQVIEVNGVKMTYAQYKAMKRKEARLSKVRESNARIIPLVAPFIKKMVNDMRLITSLCAYRRNGYRQWGTIVNEIFSYKEIETPFALFVGKVNDIHKTIANIDKVAKKNDKGVFQYVEKLSYQLDDLSSLLTDLTNGIFESRILAMPQYVGKEAIYGEGRRLGLRVLTQRTTELATQINTAYKELMKVVTDGLDAMDYSVNGKRIR